jgi:hypothetical protein
LRIPQKKAKPEKDKVNIVNAAKDIGANPSGVEDFSISSSIPFVKKSIVIDRF